MRAKCRCGKWFDLNFGWILASEQVCPDCYQKYKAEFLRIRESAPGQYYVEILDKPKEETK